MLLCANLYDQKFQKLEVANKLLKEKMITSLSNEKQLRSEIMKKEEFRRHTCQQYQQELRNCGALIEQYELETKILRAELKAQKEIYDVKVELEGKITDLQTKLKNEEKVEKEKHNSGILDLHKKINDLNSLVAKKASKSDVQKIKDRSCREENISLANSPAAAIPEECTDDESQMDSTRTPNTTQKTILKHNTVFLMDSNRRHINCSKFGRSTKKIQASQACELVVTMQSFNFDNVKNIVISTGTNDSDTRDAQSIYHDLIEAIHLLRRDFKGNIYLSQLPPRKFRRQEVVQELNQLIADTTSIEQCYVVKQNLLGEHLSDDKHIDEHYIHLFIKNIKDKMRETVGFTPPKRHN